MFIFKKARINIIRTLIQNRLRNSCSNHCSREPSLQMQVTLSRSLVANVASLTNDQAQAVRHMIKHIFHLSKIIEVKK